MSREVRAEPAALVSAGKSLGDVLTDLKSELRNLTEQADRVIGGSWRGSASDGFKVGWSRWLTGVEESFAALDTMAAVLSQAGDTFATVDGDGAAAIARASLPGVAGDRVV